MESLDRECRLRQIKRGNVSIPGFGLVSRVANPE